MRKKINKAIALLTVLGILTASGTVVYGNEENIADQEEQLTKEKESIYIDNTGCYEGMETSYSEGYVPEITENEVKIVLPLLVKGNLKEKGDAFILTMDANTGYLSALSIPNKDFEATFSEITSS